MTDWLTAWVVSILIFHVCLATLRIRRLIRLRCQCKSHLIYRAGAACLPAWQHISSRSPNVDIKWIKTKKREQQKRETKKRKTKMGKRKEHQYFSFLRSPYSCFCCYLRVFLIYLHLLIEMLHKYTRPRRIGHPRPLQMPQDPNKWQFMCPLNARLSFLYSTHIHIHTYIFGTPLKSSRECTGKAGRGGGGDK